MSTSKLNEPTLIMPNPLVQNIFGAQPMADMINPFAKKWEKVGKDMPSDKWVYNVKLYEVIKWVESQPVHMWKHYDIPINWMRDDIPIASLTGSNYLFTDEMEAWLLLRWS